MKRFMGMMPSSEIKISKTYKDTVGMSITIDAGPNGWTIIYADGSSAYKDVESTSEENFNSALEEAKRNFPELVEVSSGTKYEVSV